MGRRKQVVPFDGSKFNARIVTSFDYPPIPIRQFDWSAIDDRTYDGADDSNCPVGHGATEQEAIDDLLDRICMNKGADTDGIGCAYCSAEMGETCRATVMRAALSSAEQTT